MTSVQNSRVWLITGSSSGFGRAIAQAVLDRGEKVVVTARNPQHVEDIQTKYPDRALAVQLDVTQPEQVKAAVEKAIAKFGGIDVLVNNAGYGTMGALEELSDEATRRQFETNVFGALNMMRAVLPSMRQHRSGYILNLSSVGGFVSFPGAGIYCATKFALEALSEALVKEVEALGIKIIIVEPGAFRTDFNGRSLVLADTQIADYEPIVGGFRQWLQDMDGKQPGDPVKAAEAMIQAVNSDNPPLRLALGADAVDAIETKLESVKAEMEAWKDVAVNTAYEGAAVGAIGG
ncbi:short-chain dehydrogenase/reductase [Chroococcidiopsis sp. CCALA 051]|uniref:oxidoreductase n=1 Tax=Chroococcidiopsis sp. CCALA 051 TaxID=869949 RepID=UPI000D0E29B5|nr:oxidoreductase [Chroococcidiopsis sp. CCALA 051]MBE9017543.1 SDR family NAD(P)-dependent oxidoreductase [Chroococcidiopsidales cyanobacterium LEGE 13417]PSM49459.1 short-chain dehydrogenase/reductase [Chroococcidiopsis sp. CCALA 051]